MNSNIKDYAGRIAKSAFVEKVIERRKEKRKISEGKRKIVVIGRSTNNKFTRKDVVYSSSDLNAENGNTKWLGWFSLQANIDLATSTNNWRQINTVSLFLFDLLLVINYLERFTFNCVVRSTHHL